MKTIFQLLFLVCATVLMSSCIASLNPIYDEDELIHDPGLNGKWYDKDENKSINTKNTSFKVKTIERKKNMSHKMKKLYLWTFYDKDTASFTVHMVKIGAHEYLDFFPESFDFENDLAEICFFPVHAFCRIKRNGDNLKIHAFDFEYIKSLIENRELRMEYKMQDGHLLLMAPTEDLQKFIKKYENDPCLFENEPQIYIRKK